MAAYTGANVYIQYIYGSDIGVLSGTVTISGKHRSFDPEMTQDFADSTSGADTEKSSIKTLADGSFELTMLDDGISGGSAVRRALARGNHGTLTWGLEGTTTGKPKNSCPAWVKSFAHTTKFDGETEYKVSFQKNGNWITNFEISGSTW